MNRVVTLLAAVLAASFFVPAEAWAQGSVVQTGNAPTPGHVSMFYRNGVIGDSGGVGANTPGSGITELPVVNPTIALPQCLYDAKPWKDTSYHKLCLGAGLNGSPLLTYGSVGGAAEQGFNFEINGTLYGFPGPGNGNVLGPLSSGINELASYNNGLGSSIRQGHAQVTDTMTGSILPANEGHAIAGFSQSGFTAKQIADWVFCNNCTDPVSYDGVRGVAILTPGTSIDLVNGVGGYVMAQAPIAGAFPTSVALFGMGIADTNGSAVWGLNTALSDNRGQAVSGGTGKQLNNEMDFNFTSPSSVGTGIIFGGKSLAQPANATVISVQPLDGAAGLVSRWNQAFFTSDGATNTVLSVGSKQLAGTNVPGQDFDLVYRNAGGVRNFVTFAAQGNGNIQFANTEATQTTLTGVGLATQSPSKAQTGVSVGLYSPSTGLTAPSLSSQTFNFPYTDTGGVQQTLGLSALGGDRPSLVLNSSASFAYLFVGGTFVAQTMPTSCTSQPPGTLWNSSGTVHICP